MAIYWFQCKKCGTTITKDSMPNSSGCLEAPFHSWQKLAEVGDTNYQCRKCGTTIQTKSTPNSSGCMQAPFHSWQKL